MRRLLKLHHHKHTGKLIHHRHTSYRALAIVLILTGSVLGYVAVNMRQIVTADSIFVLATVPAPNPTVPAEIISPTSGTTVTDPNVTLTGTCEVMTPAISVAIYNGSTLMGSGPCATNGTFSVLISLLPGSTTLVPRSVTITGGYGPDGTPIVLTYTPPTPPTAGGSTPPSIGLSQPGSSSSGQSQPVSTATPLFVTDSKPVIIFGPALPADWSGDIEGGTPPYGVTIDWGDNTKSVHKSVQSGISHFKHSYKVMLPHLVAVDVVDATHAHLRFSFTAATPYIRPSAIGSGTTTSPYTTGASPYELAVAYIAYIAALCFIGIAWMRAHGYTYVLRFGGGRLQYVRVSTRTPIKKSGYKRK